MTETKQDQPTPRHMSLGEIIERLQREDPSKRVRLGFRYPHSYRGYYHDIAFEWHRSVTVGEMLADAESAMGATFQGWKGGDYTMKEFTSAWLVREEGECGESIGAVLLDLLLADAVTEDGAR